MISGGELVRPPRFNWRNQNSFDSAITSTMPPKAKHTKTDSDGGTKSSTTKVAKKKSSNSSSSENNPNGIQYISSDLLPTWFNRERCRILTPNVTTPKEASIEGTILYWMQRDMRTADNWAILLTQHLASQFNIPMKVVYVLPPPYTISPCPPTESSITASYTNMTSRHASFLLGGLQCVEQELREAHVSFDILHPAYQEHVEQRTFTSSVANDIIRNAKDNRACAIVTDFSPLRHVRSCTESEEIVSSLEKEGIALYQVDAHNIVPVWMASDKKEVGARTLRPRINKLLPDFMTTFPKFVGNEHCKDTLEKRKGTNSVDWKKFESLLRPDTTVAPVSWAKPGTKAGMEHFDFFCKTGLPKFSELRNDPTEKNICSSLSPWINYGHVSFQRLALDVRALKKHTNGTASFLEEGIVRRELSDNFLFYCPDGYDSIDGGAAEWAKASLAEHENDPREYLYSLDEFEKGETHDDLWNAAQLQVVETGKMHGFVSC